MSMRTPAPFLMISSVDQRLSFGSSVVPARVLCVSWLTLVAVPARTGAETA
jgi:hypothetical protein